MGLLFQMPVGMLALTRLGRRHAAAAAAQLALRDRHHRGDRRAAPGHRPGHHAARDGPAAGPLRAEYPARHLVDALRPPSTRGAATADRDARRPRRLTDAVRPQRPRPPPHRPGHLPRPRVLMGGGLVLFGIGGAHLGRPVRRLQERRRSSSGERRCLKQAGQAEKTLKANPNDAAAWALLARSRFQQAGQGDGYDQNTSQFTDEGKARSGNPRRPGSTTWRSTRAKPDDALASLMVQVYAPTALNQPAKGRRRRRSSRRRGRAPRPSTRSPCSPTRPRTNAQRRPRRGQDALADTAGAAEPRPSCCSSRRRSRRASRAVRRRPRSRPRVRSPPRR